MLKVFTCFLPASTRSKISRETNTEVNRFAMRPIARVTAKPRTGPLPNKNKKAAAMIVDLYERTIDRREP